MLISFFFFCLVLFVFYAMVGYKAFASWPAAEFIDIHAAKCRKQLSVLALPSPSSVSWTLQSPDYPGAIPEGEYVDLSHPSAAQDKFVYIPMCSRSIPPRTLVLTIHRVHCQPRICLCTNLGTRRGIVNCCACGTSSKD